MSGSDRSVNERTKTLVLEVELPTFYADDLVELIQEYGPPLDEEHSLGDEILREIGEVYSGLLIIETMGEKDSELVRTPVIMRGARVEDRPPTPESQYEDSTNRLAEQADERVLEYERWSDG